MFDLNGDGEVDLEEFEQVGEHKDLQRHLLSFCGEECLGCLLFTEIPKSNKKI